MILADTSAWVSFLRGGTATDHAAIRTAIDARHLVLCEPVYAEIMAGVRDHEVGDVERELARYEMIPTTWSDWETAATLKRLAARRGLTIRTMVDCLIASIALRTGSTVLHQDRDFERIAEVFPGFAQTRG
jgi:predicted nucleic acid-binding protein